MTKEIGKKIKELRKSKGLTQDEVAAKVDITRSTISNYEIGRRTPHLKDLQKIADTFGVGLDYFGVAQQDEVFNALMRAKHVFDSPEISSEEKEELYQAFMQMYLKMKGNDN